jgi:RimJ/RimL family protein N-acetyltransferase
MPSFEFETERLLLRQLQRHDAPFIVKLIGDFDVAKNLSRVPHPYSQKDADEFFAMLDENNAKGTDFVFAIVEKSRGWFMGCVGVHLRDRGEFELGYWLGKPYWRLGYASEAAKRLAEFAFHDLKAPRLIAGWFHDNPASGHVLAKLGFLPCGVEQRESRSRGHAVYCNMVELPREKFGKQRKQAEAA